MPEVNVSVDVPADQEKVWALLSDPQRFEEWMTIHTRWDGEPPADVGVGTTMTEVVTMMGMANKITWTVDVYDPPARLAISGTGMAAVRVSFTLSVSPGTGGGSKVAIDSEFTGQMIAGPLGDAIAKDARRSLDASLAKFTELVR